MADDDGTNVISLNSHRKAPRAKRAKAVESFERGAPELCSGWVLDGLPATVRFGTALKTAPAPDHELPFGYYIDERGIYTWEEAEGADGDPEPTLKRVFDAPVQVVGRLEHNEADAEFLVIAWKLPTRTKWEFRSVQKEALSDARRIGVLSKWSIPMTSGGPSAALVTYLRKYMNANDTAVTRVLATGDNGWIGSRFVWGHRVITGDGQRRALANDPSTWWDGAIVYEPGDSEVQWVEAYHAAGSWEEWLELANELLIYPRVALCIYASLASALLHVLGPTAPSFAIDLHDQTSRGKTTSLQVAASVWGDPRERVAHTQLTSWSSTTTFIERTLARRRHLPAFLDDTKDARFKESIAEVLSIIGNGRGRGRGTREGVQKTGSWQLVALTTGESAAVSWGQGGGERTRCLEVPGSPFGGAEDGAKLVARVKATFTANYGHAGPRFVQWLLSREADWPIFRQRLDTLHAGLSKGADGPMARIVTYRAILALTRKLAFEGLGLGNEDADDPLHKLWPLITADIPDAGGPRRAAEYVRDWALSQRAFFRTGKNDEARVTWLGYWHEGSQPWLGVYRPQLEQALRAARFEPEAIINAWLELGFIRPFDKDKRATKKRIPGGGYERFIMLELERFDLEAA